MLTQRPSPYRSSLPPGSHCKSNLGLLLLVNGIRFFPSMSMSQTSFFVNTAILSAPPTPMIRVGAGAGISVGLMVGTRVSVGTLVGWAGGRAITCVVGPTVRVDT